MRGTQCWDFSTWTNSIWSEEAFVVSRMKKLGLIGEGIAFYKEENIGHGGKPLVKGRMTWFWSF